MPRAEGVRGPGAGGTALAVGPTPNGPQEGLYLFPNPGSEFVTVLSKVGLLKLTVRDMLGRVVHQESLTGRTQHSLSVAGWASGDYVFRVERGDGNVEHRKFVKQ